MTLDESKKLLADMYDALNAQDLEAQHKYWHDNMVWHGPPGFGDTHGIENFKYKVLKPFYEAFPDYHVKNDIVVAEGEWISATGFLTGTHSGTYLGVEPTGKSIKMQFSDFWTIKDGKFLDNYVMVDNHGVFEQMGLKFK